MALVTNIGTNLSFRFIQVSLTSFPGQICSFIKHFLNVAVPANLLSYKEERWVHTVFPSPWSALEWTSWCAFVLTQSPVKLFTFSLSCLLRFGLKIWGLENQAPEEQMQVIRAFCSEKPNYASLRCWLTKPVNELFFRCSWDHRLKSCSCWSPWHSSYWFKWE